MGRISLDLILRSALARVSKDESHDRGLMVRDARKWAPHPEVRKATMKLKFAAALLLVAPLLAGCLERGQPTMVDAGGDDDAFCRANNVAAGSPEYVACRKDRDIARNNANARADRAQRNLGEYMLNNPVRP
jgi:hypothetical protein